MRSPAARKKRVDPTSSQPAAIIVAGRQLVGSLGTRGAVQNDRTDGRTTDGRALSRVSHRIEHTLTRVREPRRPR